MAFVSGREQAHDHTHLPDIKGLSSSSMSSRAILNFMEAVNPSRIAAVADTSHVFSHADSHTAWTSTAFDL
jgi:hypothetical protein